MSGSAVYGTSNESYMNQQTIDDFNHNVAILSDSSESVVDNNIITATAGNDLLGAFKPLTKLWAFNSIRKDVQNVISNSLNFIPGWILFLIFTIISVIITIAFISFIRAYPGN
jgi:hypothetical protein